MHFDLSSSLLILNEKFEKLERYFSGYYKKRLIGANESFLFFTHDKGDTDPKVSIYNWSIELVKKIGQNKNPILPFYFAFSSYLKFYVMFGRCYFLVRYYKPHLHCESKNYMRIVDERNGKLVKIVENVSDYFIDSNYNLIVSNAKSIRYLTLNGDAQREIIQNDIKFLYNENKILSFFDTSRFIIYFSNKYNDKTHEVLS